MKLSPMAKKIAGMICVLALVFILISVVFFRSWDFWPFAVGVLMGAVFSLSRIISLDRAVDKAIEQGEAFKKNSTLLHYFLRFVLAALILLLTAIFGDPSMLWGAGAGILTLPLAAFSMKFFKHGDEHDAE
ncbi:MAG: hypothetical protein FWD99_04770 [Oscillospiraceae bacterium]|nr:hypothetical protein [Oscillospiraceae bacterium]